MAQYQPGQRWISDSEAELGLGTILAQDGRFLTVLYPATGDTRQYALRSAPLTRVRFSPGDEITHFEGWKLSVREVEDVDGLLVYHGVDAENQPRSVPEAQLSNFIQFRQASDRLFAGQIDPLGWFALRYFRSESPLERDQLRWVLLGSIFSFVPAGLWLIATPFLGSDIHFSPYLFIPLIIFPLAGGYAIQNTAFDPVQRVEGCYANVMGLPLCNLYRIMAGWGRAPPRHPLERCPWPAQYGGCSWARAILEAGAR